MGLVALEIALGMPASGRAQDPVPAGTVHSAPVVPKVHSLAVAPGVPAISRWPSRFVVVLDAGHGGEDGGAQLGGAVAEKTVTLALSVRLRSLLTARGISVVTTREANVAMDDVARSQIANRVGGGAAACLSLHATQAGAGLHLFVSSLGPAEQTRFMPWKTAQAAFVTRSLKLESAVNSALEQSAAGANAGNDAGDAGGKAVPVTMARTSLPGLDSMACPSVAVEMSPLRGPDRKVLTEVTDAEYQTQIVEALAAAMMEWRTEIDPGASAESDSASGGGRQP